MKTSANNKKKASGLSSITKSTIRHYILAPQRKCPYLISISNDHICELSYSKKIEITRHDNHDDVVLRYGRPYGRPFYRSAKKA